MEQRSEQEVIALHDVAYVICYGHFPNHEIGDKEVLPSKETKVPSINKPTISAQPPSSSSLDNPTVSVQPPTPSSPLEEGNPFSETVNESEDDLNPFAEDQNPFTEVDPDESPPSPPPNIPCENGQASPTDLTLNSQTSNQDTQTAVVSASSSVKGTPSPEQSTTPSPQPPSQSNPQPTTDAVHFSAPSVVETNSSTLVAKHLKDINGVSQSHAKEVIAEAFNLTPLDMNRLVVDAWTTKESPSFELLLKEVRTECLPESPPSESYPILFLRATLGQEDRFTNFSSTSATNTIQQGLTLAIGNMYHDTLTMEVWSANILPVEEPQSPPVLDLLGRIMTGSMRLKRDNARSTRTAKWIKDSTKEEANAETEGDTSNDTSCQSPSPKAIHAELSGTTSDVVNENGMQNGDANEHNDYLNQSIDTTDSVSINSEFSTDPLRTSTPRARSSSLQQLETTNDDSLSKKKGFRSSFRKKSSNLARSFQSNFKKSTQSISDGAASPKHSRKASDTHSIQSVNSDVSSQGPCDEDTPDTSKKGIKKTNMNREASRSTLSITSLTRTLSMRISSQKATQAIKRFGSVRNKKTKDLAGVTASTDSVYHPQDTLQLPGTRNESPDNADSVDGTSEDQESPSHSSLEITGTPSSKTFSRKSLTPRTMRPFKNLNLKVSLKTISDSKDETKDVNPPAKSPNLDIVKKIRAPDNPEEIQGYLSSIERGHLQAQLLAHTSIPIKDIVGVWEKEAWFPMTLGTTKVNEITPNKSKKKKGCVTEVTRPSEPKGKVVCKIHVRLSLPAPESELRDSAYETYRCTYSKLVNLQVKSMNEVEDYKGDVGAVGSIILEQLSFFSRVTVFHQKLATWLVMAEIKPSDSILLLPLLTKISQGLHESQYLTSQKQKLAESLSTWVRYVMAKEFEVLHSAFPSNSLILHLPRLEHFLRCFNIMEEDSELRVLFERVMNTMNLPSLTDQLKGALVKHAEMWIEALNKEPVNQESDLNLEAAEVSPDDLKWHDDLKRAAHLTKPIVDFLEICIHAYQPIFMVEMSVDYLYWVLPQFLTAALHLVNNTHHFSVEKINNLHRAYIPPVAQATWKICSNFSQINKTSVDCQLPVHLIELEFRTAFSNTVIQWLALSEILSLEEVDNDIQQDEFVAVDSVKGYSHSAVSMVDILKAMMSRLRGLCWPGGVRPGVNTLVKIAQKIFSLVNEYTNRVTHTYTTRGCSPDRISTEVCVVVRNVEHVCDEARHQLSQLASWAEEESQVQEELPPDEGADGSELKPEGRNQKLQKHIDYTAEILLQRCLPRLEQLLTQGVTRDSSDYIINSLETALQPIQDRLYFAEPLLYELWMRLFQHATHLKGTFIHGQWRRDLQRLHKILKATYTFLTDSQLVGFQLPEEDVLAYEEFVNELKMLSASSAGLVAKYYNERYSEQCKEVAGPSTPVLVTNVTFTREGLRVYIIQAPGNNRGVLVKARVEPQEWFPTALPQKTRLIKAGHAVFDETLHFPVVHNDGPPEEKQENGDVGGVLVLQTRTPKLFVGSVVHNEAIVPLATVPRVTKENQNTVHHSRLPLTRPWNFKNYKSLETLRGRAQDIPAMTFLKELNTRWEVTDDSTSTQEFLKLNSSFIRSGSTRKSGKNSRRPSIR